MENLILITPCEDSCGCMTLRCSVMLISLVNLTGCFVDTMCADECSHPWSALGNAINSAKVMLLTLFQMANILLLLASASENALLVQLYLWYTLGFIMMGFAVTIVEFMLNMKYVGLKSFATFIPEVAYLFVIFRCLPIVDSYRKRLIAIDNRFNIP